MAPNLRLIGPVQETLLPPLSVDGKQNFRGIHQVASTYAKLRSDMNQSRSSISERPVSFNPSPNHHQDNQRQGQASWHHQNYRVDPQKRRVQALPKGRVILKSSPLLEVKSLEDDFNDDSSEMLPSLAETLSILRRRGGIADGTVSTRRFTPSLNANQKPQLQLQDLMGLQSRPTGAASPFASSATATALVSSFSPSPSPQKNNSGVIKQKKTFKSPATERTPTSPLTTTYRPHQKASDTNRSIPPQRKQSEPQIHTRRELSLSSKSTERTPIDTEPSFLLREILLKEEQRRIKEGIKEELADFSNLFHHEKSLDELTKNTYDVAVKEEWLFTSEGATAVILGGMCSIIFMFICLIFLLKKWRRVKKKDGLEDFAEEEKSDFHKSHFGTDFNIPGFAHLPFIHSLIQHLPSKHSSPPNLIDIEEEMNNTKLGRIWFSVRYDDEKSDLHVNILHARYPNGRGLNSNPGDLWVEGVILSPMNTVKATSKTSTRRATPSPVFNHSFLFLLPKKDVKSYILKLTLHDIHPKNGEEVVGSIIFPFSSIELNSDEIYCRDLL